MANDLPAPDFINEARVCEVDCSVPGGQQTHRDFTKDEKAAANVDWWESIGAAVEAFAQADDDAQRKAAVQEKVAKAAGVTIEELREALS